MSDQNKNQEPAQFAKYSAHIRTMQDDLSGNNFETTTPRETEFFKENSAPAPVSLPTPEPKPEPIEKPQEQQRPLQEYQSSPFYSSEDQMFPENKPQTFLHPQENISPKTAGLNLEKKADLSHFVPVETLRPGKTPSSGKRKFFILTTMLFLLCAAALGIYYFLATKQPANNEIPSQQELPEQEISINPVLEKFSSTNPNYLSMDISGLPAESLQEKIKGVANEIAQAGSGETFEFIITDANNNPVSFSIFCLATKINLSENVLKSVGESFSLYMTAAEGNTHLAIAVQAIDSDSIKQGLLKEEATLPIDLTPLFLEEKPAITKGLFKQGTYGAITTKYLNLNETETLSIDYAITSDTLYIATSKNTLRSTIDKYSTKSSISAPTNQ